MLWKTLLCYCSCFSLYRALQLTMCHNFSHVLKFLLCWQCWVVFEPNKNLVEKTRTFKITSIFGKQSGPGTFMDKWMDECIWFLSINWLWRVYKCITIRSTKNKALDQVYLNIYTRTYAEPRHSQYFHFLAMWWWGLDFLWRYTPGISGYHMALSSPLVPAGFALELDRFTNRTQINKWKMYEHLVMLLPISPRWYIYHKSSI